MSNSFPLLSGKLNVIIQKMCSPNFQRDLKVSYKCSSIQVQVWLWWYLLIISWLTYTLWPGFHIRHESVSSRNKRKKHWGQQSQTRYFEGTSKGLVELLVFFSRQMLVRFEPWNEKSFAMMIYMKTHNILNANARDNALMSGAFWATVRSLLSSPLSDMSTVRLLCWMPMQRIPHICEVSSFGAWMAYIIWIDTKEYELYSI